MHNLRNVMSWLYAISTLLCLRIALSRILALHQDHAFLPLRNLLLPTEFLVLAAIYGRAWWAIFKGQPSARAWGVIASMTYILYSLSEVIYFSRSVWGALGVMLATGIVGLVAFLWRDEQHNSSRSSSKSADYGSGVPRL